MMAVGVFISYNHLDIKIANVLKQCLLALSDDLSVFIDHAGLVGGDDYEPTLARNIAASQWFLMICSGPPGPDRDMGWCLIEAGQFRAKLLNENSEKLIRSRLISIHDDARPRQLAHFESVRVSTVDRENRKLDLGPGSDNTFGFENTDAFKLFASILERSATHNLRNLADGDTRGLVREQTRRLIRAFVEAQGNTRLPEVVLQPRISFRLPPILPGAHGVLFDDTPVIGYDASLKEIFAINGLETTWGQIKQRVKELDGNNPLWVTDIEEAAMDAAKDFTPEQPDGLCLSVSDGKFYRVLFARYEPYRGGARTCFVLFIPSRPRQFDMRKQSSVLLSALILSIRFRQKILPFIETVAAAPKSKKAETLVKLERILHQVETEAIEFGLSMGADDEEPPMMQAVSKAENKAFMDRCLKSWAVGRGSMAASIAKMRAATSEASRMKAAVEAEKITVEELKKVRLINGKFIEMLTEELLCAEKVATD